MKRAEERLALHELVRIWVGRQEDWTLLQRAESGSIEKCETTLPHLLNECELREEARRWREEETLRKVQEIRSGDPQWDSPPPPLHVGTSSKSKAAKSPALRKKPEQLQQKLFSPYIQKHTRRHTKTIGSKPRRTSTADGTRPPPKLGKKELVAARPQTAPSMKLSTTGRVFDFMDLQKQLSLNVATHQREDGSESALSVLKEKIDTAHNTVMKKIAAIREGLTAALVLRSLDDCTNMVDLGETKAAAVLATKLRMRWAAITIQMRWKTFCRKRAEENKSRLDDFLKRKRAEAQREASAIKIQSRFRGWRGRLRAERLKREHAEEMKENFLLDLKHKMCAIRIQRAFRRHARISAIRQKSTFSSHPGQGNYMDRDRIEGCVITIQAHVRGWLARKSQELWWSKKVVQMRNRREGIKQEKEHSINMCKLELAEKKIREIRSAGQEWMRQMEVTFRQERKSFEAAWGAWLKSVVKQASTSPLPKGWVAKQDPMMQKSVYFDMCNMKLHSIHPAVASLQGLVENQRAIAERQFEKRIQPLLLQGQKIQKSVELGEILVCRGLISQTSILGNKKGLM
ncbi:hypothetical protein BSKO_00470 [Bryopsis sp. KO-2023]|nr:hypothetical protein BSKO_00470 [Bryopsis sp. KO-2023]